VPVKRKNRILLSSVTTDMIIDVDHLMRRMAQAVSLIFHPLLIITYMLMILLAVNPYLFGVNRWTDSKLLIFAVFASSFFLPVTAVFLMKKLGMVETWSMANRQDRIGPFIATGIFYLWIFLSVKDNNIVPRAFGMCVLGATISLFIMFVVNIFFKISLHAAGMGGLIGMIYITMRVFSYNTFSMNIPFMGVCNVSMTLLLLSGIFCAGLVGTSRLVLHAHTLREILAGFALGFLMQFVAYKLFV
jgi:hypothetical protein